MRIIGNGGSNIYYVYVYIQYESLGAYKSHIPVTIKTGIRLITRIVSSG